MARKKSEDEPCGNWMDTYGDMVTLLLTFFVMLFSMSSVDMEKFAVLVRAFTSQDPDTINIVLDQTGINDEFDYPSNRTDEENKNSILQNATLEEISEMVPQNFDDLYEYLKAYVEKSGMEGSVTVSKPADGCVFLRFQDNIFFDPDSSALRRDATPLLDFLGNCLLGVQDQVMTVNINGHTADPRIDNYGVSDWRLSGERAANVAVYFEEKKGFDPKKLLPIGYGKNFPVADNSTPEGREKNRRVDMMIISDNTTMGQEEILTSILAGTFDPTRYPEQGGTRDVLIPAESEELMQGGSSIPDGDDTSTQGGESGSPLQGQPPSGEGGTPELDPS